MTLLIIALYFSILIGIGLTGKRFLRRTGEDYFLANRTIGPFVLLMTLFGTQMTAFALLGASGEAYQRGIGVFALMASSSALVVPLVFHFLGTRVWEIGQRLGCLTQAQFFRARWQSDVAASLLFVFLLVLLIPYLLIGIMGAGITLHQVTSGALSEWLGSLVVCAVVILYVVTSGLRGTSWANCFQALVFLSLGLVTFFYISSRLGGLRVAIEGVRQTHPELLTTAGGVGGLELFSYLFIPLSAAMFPHLFMHWLSARDASAFRLPVAAYPLCIALLWVPVVLMGILARIPFPDLEGPAVNSVLVRMIQHYSPELLSGLLAAGVLAAIMSSLDSQVLSVGTIFTQDVVKHFGFHDEMDEKRQVLFGRLFVALILAACFFLSLVTNRTIFSLGIWSFTGFSALLPVLLAALFWRRSTKWGALASTLVTALLWAGFFWKGWQVPGYSIGGTGLLPVVVIMAASSCAMIVGSYLSSPPGEAVLKAFFPEDRDHGN